MESDQSAMAKRLAEVGRRIRDINQVLEAELEVRYRLVAEARDGCGMTAGQIGRALGVTRSGVYNILGRPR